MLLIAIVVVLILTLVGSILIYYYISPMSTLYIAIPGFICTLVLMIMRYMEHRISGIDTVHLPNYTADPIANPIANNTIDTNDFDDLDQFSISHSSTRQSMYSELDAEFDDADKFINTIIDKLLEPYQQQYIINITNLREKINSIYVSTLSNYAFSSDDVKSTITSHKDDIIQFINNQLTTEVKTHNNSFGYTGDITNITTSDSLDDLNVIDIKLPVDFNESDKQTYMEYLYTANQIIKVSLSNTSPDKKLVDNLIDDMILCYDYSKILGNIYIKDLANILSVYIQMPATEIIHDILIPVLKSKLSERLAKDQ